MKITEEQQKAQEFLVTIYKKAWEDSTFKQKLIDNPIKTLNKFTGKTANLPKDKTILVEDQTNPNHIYINIPAKPNLEDMELSEEQLEMVAGGFKDPSTEWVAEQIAAGAIMVDAVYNWISENI